MPSLVALRWRDVDFDGEAIRVSGSYSAGTLGLPKSGKARSVAMVPEVASALAKLSGRGYATGDDDLVFAGDKGGYSSVGAAAPVRPRSREGGAPPAALPRPAARVRVARDPARSSESPLNVGART